MKKHLDANIGRDTASEIKNRELRDDELDLVSGGQKQKQRRFGIVDDSV